MVAGEKVLGVDLGKWKGYFAVVEGKEDRFSVGTLKVVDNERLEEALEELWEKTGFGRVVVDEPHPTPLKKSMSAEDLATLRKGWHRVSKWCKRRGVEFESHLASRSVPWYRDPPGWRQHLTGLTRPSEWDLYRALMGKKRGGKLKGFVPKNPNLIDAIGLAVYGLEREEP